MFSVEPLADGLRIRFSSSLPLLDQAVAEVIELLRRRQVEGSLFEIKLLLREALLNAVMHGNRSDPGLLVDLEARVPADRLLLCVTDEGPGFPWQEQLERPASPEATSGRGLTIMTLYADAVRYNAVGNQVRLDKRIPGLDGAAASDGPSGAVDPQERTS